MDYQYREELTKEERSTEVAQMMERGNHQLAKNEPEQVKLLLNKNVTHGFSLPILPEAVLLFPGALVQPFGMAIQWTLDDQGA
jgi:hypothetical protein